MVETTAAHTEKETLYVEVNVPAHEQRGPASGIFTKTRKDRLDAGECCWVCGKPHTKEDPLEAHHRPVERCFAEAWEWPAFATDCKAGMWGSAAQAFDWGSFFDENGKPKNVYAFVDNMHVNGMILCKAHHTAKLTGVHMTPEAVFFFQRYAVAGYVFDSAEVIVHQAPAAPPS